MNKTRENLSQSNLRTYLWNRFKTGLRLIPGSSVKSSLTVLYWIAALVLLFQAGSPATGLLDRLLQPFICFFTLVCAVLFFVTCVTISAIPRGAVQVADAFRRVHLTNSAGEPPLLTRRYEQDGKTVIDVFTQGTTVAQIQESQEPLESALGKRITKIEPGEGNQFIRLHLAPGDTKLPELAYLPQSQQPASPKILLGVSLDGPVAWDPDKVPHLLVGGSTGSGKTTLVKSVISQCLLMHDSDGKPAAEVYVSDLKGGLDYPVRWRNRDCSFAVTAGDTLSMSSQIVQELKHREDMYRQISNSKGVPCSSLKDFNRLCPGSRFRRVFLVIDEIAELTDTTGMGKPHKEEAAAIVSNLATIARMGRAFGIHLVVSTQRPDAMVVPGQVKNNLDGRICGKADNVLSQIILDNTDAADHIPKDSQGLFLNQDGTLFRGYLFDDKADNTPEGGYREL